MFDKVVVLLDHNFFCYDINELDNNYSAYYKDLFVCFTIGFIQLREYLRRLEVS